MRRPYHTFKGFDIGTKELSKWIHTPHIFCPYCGGTVQQIGAATYEREIFSLHRCIHDDCSKLFEGKEDARRNLYIRWDVELKKKVDAR